MVVVAGCIALIGYSYVGYPALVWAVSRTRPPRRRPAPSTDVRVTVVISAYQEADVIEEKLVGTLALAPEVNDLQVIVAVDGEDSTVDAVRRIVDDRVELLHHPERRGKSAAISDAVARARGDIVVFTDANATVEAGALRALVAWFADPTVGVVSGAKHVVGPDDAGDEHGDGAYWRYESTLKEWETRVGTTVAVVGELLAIRRDLMPVLPRDIVNDDFFLAMHALRHGYSVIYEPQARTTEPPSPDLAAERIRRRRIVAGRAQAGKRWKDLLPYRRPGVMAAVVSHKYMRPLVPWAAIVGMAGAIVSVMRPRRERERLLAGVVMASASVFLGAAAGAPMIPARLRRARRVASMCRMLCNANVAAAQGTVDHFRRRTSALWPRVTRTSAR